MEERDNGGGGEAEALTEEELRERLIQFCDQIEQVDAALQLTPNDADLLQVKADLSEVFKMTAELLHNIKENKKTGDEVVEEIKIKPTSPVTDMFAEGDHDDWVSEAKHSDTQTSIRSKKRMRLMKDEELEEEKEAERKREELREAQEKRIEAGERKIVRAIYSGDGRWYDAELLSDKLSENGTYIIHFFEYGNTEEVKAEDIMIKGVTMKHYDYNPDTDKKRQEDAINLGFENRAFGEWAASSNKVALRLMASMGYVQGKGLGKDGRGIVEPLGIGLRAPPQKKQLLGLGHEERELFEQGKDEERKKRKRRRRRKGGGDGQNNQTGNTPPVDHQTRMFNFLNSNLNTPQDKGKGKEKEQRKKQEEKDNMLKKMKKQDLEENIKKNRDAQEKLDLKMEQLKQAYKKHQGDPGTQRKIAEKMRTVQKQITSVKGTDKELAKRLKIKEETYKMTIF